MVFVMRDQVILIRGGVRGAGQVSSIMRIVSKGRRVMVKAIFLSNLIGGSKYKIFCHKDHCVASYSS